MSINDEFKKMSDDSTNPIEAINEVYGYKDGRLSWEENPAPVDVDVVSPESKPAVYVPPSITKPAQNTLMPIVSAFRDADNHAKIEFTKKLVSQYVNNDRAREGFKDILRSCGLVVESVIMPPEQVIPPEPTLDAQNQEEAKNSPKTILSRIEEIKVEIDELKGSGDEEKEKAYDDITSACDLIIHHLLDINEDLGMKQEPMEF